MDGLTDGRMDGCRREAMRFWSYSIIVKTGWDFRVKLKQGPECRGVTDPKWLLLQTPHIAVLLVKPKSPESSCWTLALEPSSNRMKLLSTHHPSLLIFPAPDSERKRKERPQIPKAGHWATLAWNPAILQGQRDTSGKSPDGSWSKRRGTKTTTQSYLQVQGIH